jgi:L-fuconolactonase
MRMIHLFSVDAQEVVHVEPVTDAHVHVWELARRPQSWIDPLTMAVIDRDHPVAELEAELIAAGVTGSVLVQVLNDPDETDDLMWAGRSPVVEAVVGWVDLLDPGVADRLDELTAHPSGTRLAGVRHQSLAEADPAGWLERVAETAALPMLGERGLVCDLILRSEHLDIAHVVLRDHPGTTFVLDHAGKAPVVSGWGSEESRLWADRLMLLAGLENLVVKLSGLTTMADLRHWSTVDLTPYVDHLFGCFGPDRLLFGSDWPVSRRAGDYGRTIATAGELVADLVPVERAEVLSGTARRIYGLVAS